MFTQILILLLIAAAFAAVSYFAFLCSPLVGVIVVGLLGGAFFSALSKYMS